MKRILFLATALAALASCDEGGTPSTPEITTETYIDATSKTAWHYYSFAADKVIGSADESAENNAAWGARTDWDIAIQRYNVRTNSGAFTTKGAQGGVCIFDTNKADTYGNITPSTTFAAVQSAKGLTFAADKAVVVEGHGGSSTSVVMSAAVAVQLWRNASGPVMPPDYKPAPVCVFRTADGKGYYKVQFTQYINDEGKTGHVKFKAAKIEE